MPLTVLGSAKPRKRPYRKTTTGCTNCKVRKVKCDERRPVCSNCAKRFVGVDCCDYRSDVRPQKTSDAQLRASKTPASQSQNGPEMLQSVSITPSGISDSGSSHLLELRLIHRYTQATCGRPSRKSMVPLMPHALWEVDVPQMAFSSEIVLNALLGLSSLNLMALNPTDSTLARASKFYFQKAIAKQRDALVHIDASNAEPIVIAAVLISHHSWLETHSHMAEPYQIDLQTFRLCQGTKALLQVTAPFMAKFDWPVETAKKSNRRPVRHEAFMESALHDMLAFRTAFTHDGVLPEHRRAYEKAAEEIIETCSTLASPEPDDPPPEQQIVSLLHRVPSEFPQLLERVDPIASALLARNISLLWLIEDTSAWWIHGTGESKVARKAVLGINSLIPAEWGWTMEWPMKILSGEITLDM